MFKPQRVTLLRPGVEVPGFFGWEETPHIFCSVESGGDPSSANKLTLEEECSFFFTRNMM